MLTPGMGLPDKTQAMLLRLEFSAPYMGKAQILLLEHIPWTLSLFS